MVACLVNCLRTLGHIKASRQIIGEEMISHRTVFKIFKKKVSRSFLKIVSRGSFDKIVKSI